MTMWEHAFFCQLFSQEFPGFFSGSLSEIPSYVPAHAVHLPSDLLNYTMPEFSTLATICEQSESSYFGSPSLVLQEIHL